MTDPLFDRSELEVLADCCQLVLDVDAMLDRMFDGHSLEGRPYSRMTGENRAIIRELADRARTASQQPQGGDETPATVAAAADALAADYGRSHVERLPAGEWVVSGITDDIVREHRVFEADGTLAAGVRH